MSEIQMERIAEGLDSEVFYKGGLIEKWYVDKDPINGKPINLELVKRYQQISNQASALEIPRQLDLFKFYKVAVNPIIDVSQDPQSGRVIAVSEFVDGRTLKEFMTQEGVERNQIEGWLNSLGRYFEEHLNLDKNEIWLMTVNMKMDEEGKKIIITDLCGSIASLKNIAQ